MYDIVFLISFSVGLKTMIKKEPGTVVHICNLITLGDQGKKTTSLSPAKQLSKTVSQNKK